MKQYYQLNEKWVCKECQREFDSRQATTSHIFRAHTNPGISCGGHKKGEPSWNKGLTKETDERVARNAKSMSDSMKKLYENGTLKPSKMGEAARERLSLRQSIRNSGGRCKWFPYNGSNLQGTWELNVAIALDSMNIKWEKVTKPWSYIDDHGKKRKYTPDLYLEDFDIFLEIKGYWWGNDKRKMEIINDQYPDRKIFIVEKEEYKKILDGELVWSFQRLPEEQ